MNNFYFSRNIGNDRTLYLSPITDSDYIASGQEMSDSSGYFLYEKQSSDFGGAVEIIARVPDENAVFKLREMLSLD